MPWYDKYLKDNPTFTDQYYICWENEVGYHRLNGPAYINNCNEYFWFKNGIRHRIDGPASRWSFGKYDFYINGIEITYEVTQWIKENAYPEWIDESSWDDTIKMHFKLTFL